MGIDKFFGAKRINLQETTQRRRDAADSKTAARAFERACLKPDPIRSYTKKAPAINDISRLTVRLVFPAEDALAKFKRYFRVANYVEPSVTNIEMLIALLDELDVGNIRYDKEAGRIVYRRRSRHRRASQAMV